MSLWEMEGHSWAQAQHLLRNRNSCLDWWVVFDIWPAKGSRFVTVVVPSQKLIQINRRSCRRRMMTGGPPDVFMQRTYVCSNSATYTSTSRLLRDLVVKMIHCSLKSLELVCWWCRASGGTVVLSCMSWLAKVVWNLKPPHEKWMVVARLPDQIAPSVKMM